MDAGHGGASGRFEAIKELARNIVLLDLEEIKN
jgi:oligopeptidase B